MAEVNSLISALESGDFHTALPLLENMTSDQLSQLTLPDKCTPLHYACRHGSVDVAQQLITHCKYSIENKDGKGRTPLHTAAQYGQVSTLKYLLHNLFMNEESSLSLRLTSNTTLSRSLSSILKLKLSDRHRDESGNTPLHTACVHGHLDIVQLLTSEIGFNPHNTNNVTGYMYLKSFVQQHSNMADDVMRERFGDVNEEEDGHGMPPISLAAGGGHLGIIKYLIEEKGVEPHFLIRNSEEEELGVSPVLTASCGGHLHVVKYLLEKHGYNISQDFRAVILFFTCLVGHMDLVTYLITEADYDPHCTSTYKVSCLGAACLGGHLNVVKYLVGTYHCDPLCPDENKFTPLHIAAANGRLEVVSYFATTLDCDLLIKNKYDDTPLHNASFNGHLEVVKFFIEDMKCDPNCKGQHERIPLHYASEGGHLDVVKYLVDTHHCDPLCPDENKFTPLHIAAANGRLEVVSYFATILDYNLLIKNKYNDTPLHSASFNGHLEVVKFFIEDMKCDPNCKGQYGRTPLHHASEGGHLDEVKYLVDTHHCDPLCPDQDNETPLDSAALNREYKAILFLVSTLDYITPLHVPTLYNNLEVVKYFIEDLYYDPHCKNQRGRTPLHLASEGGHLDVVKYLVDTHHCDPLCPDQDNETPLDSAALNREYKAILFLVSTLDYITPLHVPTLYNNLEVVKYFIEDLYYDPHCKNQRGRTPLHLASEGGHLDVVKYLVDTHHCDPLCPDNDFMTPLHIAAANGRLEVVSYFATTLDCDLLIKNKYDDTPLHNASFNGHLEVVKFFIEDMKCDPNCKGQHERIPLHYASEGGHLDVVKYLVDTHHCDPLCPDENKFTPLHIAAANGRLEVVSYFATILDYNLLIKNKYDDTPLHNASFNGHLEVVKFFIEDMKCDPNCKGQHERIPLHYASEGGHLDVVKYFVDTHHCDPLCPDENKFTPLHIAAANGRLEVVSYFATILDYNLLIKNKYNDTPLHSASFNGHLEVVKFFIEDMKCDPNCKGQYGRTPLHHASEGGHLDEVKYLVDTHHCDPLCPDQDNETPLDSAALNREYKAILFLVSTLDYITPLHVPTLYNNLEVVKYFIEDLYYDPHCKNQRGRTPLHLASEGGHLDVVKYLVDTHHCDPLCPDNDFMTPLHIAAANGRLEVVSYFATTLDCNLLIKNKYDDTPLHSASFNGHLEVVKFFIEDMKCDPNCKGQFERTPLHHASGSGHLDVVKYFVDTHHCDPLCPDEYNETPLHRAAANCQLEIVQYFANIPDCNLQVNNAKNKSPLDIASIHGHHKVESFLLRATTTKPVLLRDIISPSLSIFFIGNSGSGKSTLVKALSDESSLLGGFFTVKSTAPLTAGIVPTTINSRVFGSVNIYDFAGHEEYHVSHEILLEQTSHPLILLTVDISLPLQIIEKQLLYWLSMLSNFQTSHVVVIGSHADLVREMKIINQKIASLVSTESSIWYHGFIQCDCRYSNSSGLNLLRQQLKSIFRSIQVILALCESNDSNRLCASLMHILKYSIPEKAIISMSEVMKHIKESAYEEFLDVSLLVQTCNLLSSNGHLLFMSHENNILEKSLLVLNKRVILQEVHACLRDIKAYLPNEFGLIKENELREILSESLKNMLEPEQAIKYLIFTQFCTEVASDQLISPPDGEKNVTYYFFPNLALASRPGDLLPPGDLKYTHLYTWCLKCSHARQFFTPRYLHTLFIQLIKCEKNVREKLEYKIWNKGILIVHNNGTRSIIEVTDQTTRVSLAIQCVEGCESCLVKQRSLLISLIKSMAHKICPRVKVEEFFILSQNTFPPENSQLVSIARIAHSLIDSLETVSYNDGDILQHALVKDLLYFDSLLVIEGLILRDIFTQYQSNNVVPLATVTRIHSAVETCRELQEWFEDETGQCRRDMTYSQLYRELIKYSIFTVKNSDVSYWRIHFYLAIEISLGGEVIDIIHDV